MARLDGGESMSNVRGAASGWVDIVGGASAWVGNAGLIVIMITKCSRNRREEEHTPYEGSCLPNAHVD